MRKRYDRYYDSDDNNWYSSDDEPVEYDYSGKIFSIGGKEVNYDSDGMISNWDYIEDGTEIDFMKNLHPYNQNNSTYNDRYNKIVNKKDYYWGDSEIEYDFVDGMISNWDYIEDDTEIDFMEKLHSNNRNNSNNPTYDKDDNKIFNENDCFSKSTHITKKGKKKKHKKHLFSNKSHQSDSHSKDSDASYYDYYYDNSSIRDLNDYSNYDGTGAYVENAEYEDGKMVSICGKDIEYEDDKMSTIGGEIVSYDEDGHMSSIGRDDVNYGSDGNFSGWGSENIEYGDNNPYL